MARYIMHEEKGPLELPPSAQSRWLCRCGLSKNPPWCDGSHKRTLDEEEGKAYEYKPDGTREEVKR